MEYLSGYYWQQGDAQTSLVLKQLVYHAGEIPVLFGCMQSCGNELLVEALTDWFYQEALHLCKKGSLEPEMLETHLEKVIEKILKKVQRGVQSKVQSKAQNEVQQEMFSLTVLLCVDDCFVLWNQGTQRVHLLNTRFRRPCAKCIADKEGETVLCGKWQQGVGILVTTEGFEAVLSQQQITECLAVEELRSEERVQKRLQELGKKACELGGQQVGALLAVTC